MLKLLYAVCTIAFCVCLLLSFERPAMAYVDPGSGLFLFQSISSLGVGVLFFMRRRLRALFGRSKSKGVAAAEPVGPAAHLSPAEYEGEKAA